MSEKRVYEVLYVEDLLKQIERLEGRVAELEAVTKDMTKIHNESDLKRIAELESALRRIATRDYNETAQAFAEQALGGDDE